MYANEIRNEYEVVVVGGAAAATKIIYLKALS